MGLITSIRAVFAELLASNFPISVAVIETVLERFGEGDQSPKI
jgi:predicted nucleic acid-binding protein